MSVEIRWWSPPSRSNQKVLKPVKTRPLSGMPVGKTQFVRADPVAGDQEQAIAKVIDVAHLCLDARARSRLDSRKRPRLDFPDMIVDARFAFRA